jgi:hypothetical protein
MYSIARLDLVRAQRFRVLHNSTRVDQAHPIYGHILETLARELGLEIEDGGALCHSDRVLAFAGGFDLEGYLSVGEWSVVCRHLVFFHGQSVDFGRMFCEE